MKDSPVAAVMKVMQARSALDRESLEAQIGIARQQERDRFTRVCADAAKRITDQDVEIESLRNTVEQLRTALNLETNANVWLLAEINVARQKERERCIEIIKRHARTQVDNGALMNCIEDIRALEDEK